MKGVHLLIVGILLIPLGGTQSLPLKNFFCDYAVFWIRDTLNFVEFYYSVPYSFFAFETLRTSETLSSQFHLNLAIHSNLRETLATPYQSTKVIRILKGIPLENLARLEGIGFYQGAGRFPFKLTISQATKTFTFSAHSVRELKATDTLFSPDFRTTPAISSILFASYLGPDSLKGLFYRNGYYFTPNPSRRFTKDDKFVYVYLEVYNLSSDTSSYEVTYTIKGESQEWILCQKREKARKRNFVLPFSFPVAGMADGKYKLSVTVEDLSLRERAKREKEFIIASLPYEEISRIQTPLDTVLEDAFFLIATEKEKMSYKKLPEEDKRTYLAQYFKRKEYFTSGEENLSEIRERLAYVEKNFGKRRRASDRARIVMKYGIPPEIEVHSFKENVPYHEHWRYPDKNYHFIFMTIKGEQEPILLWSNVPKERNYPGWERYIDPDEYEELR